MFEAATYVRETEAPEEGRSVRACCIFLANEESPMNYPANTYHYRQDSTFLYFFGLSFARPGRHRRRRRGPADRLRRRPRHRGHHLDGAAAHAQEPRRSRSASAGRAPLAGLRRGACSRPCRRAARSTYLPPYRARERPVAGQAAGHPRRGPSRPRPRPAFIKAVVAQRIAQSRKEEIREMETAVAVSRRDVPATP
ncbi:MAG: aminopeptidase P N-terminal domain-containing protein [Desulfobacterales bacterium]|nr:aminopeptidase P N-terminal domain-containing protein [Desulfobacterales bacterium]